MIVETDYVIEHEEMKEALKYYLVDKYKIDLDNIAGINFNVVNEKLRTRIKMSNQVLGD